MIAVYKKELRSYLRTMTGYVFIAFILVVIGIYYAFINLNLSSPRFELALNNVQFVFLVFVPMLTMRVLAEERAQRTDQLLLTLPLKVSEIVLGKYFAMVTLYAVPMGIICFYPLILATAGPINYAAAYLAILGFFLLGCANIALGELLSSVTESSVIAAVMSFGLLLLLYLMNSISGIVPNTAIASFIAFTVLFVLIAAAIYQLFHSVVIPLVVTAVLEAVLTAVFLLNRPMLEGAFPHLLSQFYMNGRLTSFFDGIFDIRAILYYLSIAAAALFLTAQTVEKRRWNDKYSRRTGNGIYSVLMTAIVVVGAVLVNLAAERLSSRQTQFDYSTARLYTLTDTTKDYLDALDQEISVYYICEKGQEDDTVKKLLERYEDACSRIHVEQIDPVLYPRFTSQYTDDIVENNSIIVASDRLSKVIPAEDLYITDYSSQTGGYVKAAFDGEGQVTTGIDYVISDQIPVFYYLNGNGESELGASFAGMAEKNNISLQTLNLLSTEEIPEDAAAIIMNAPARDYTEKEAEAILRYLENGGRALIYSNYTPLEMPNFNSVLSDYGIGLVEGIVLEGDSGHYMTYQYCLLPEINYTAITADLYQRTYLLIPMAQGIQELKPHRDSISYQPILVTSDVAYSKVNVQGMSTSEKEAGDIDGPFTLGMLIEEDVDHNSTYDTEVICFSSAYLLDEDYNANVSGGNAELFSGALAYLRSGGITVATAVPAKSLQVQYLTMTSFTANFWTVVCVFVLPAAFLVTGTVIWLKRRKH